MQYDDDVTFNENNVTMYLTELEEYISAFITYLAHREKNPDAPISALSLDNMTNKEFDKGAIAIDAPNAHDFVATVPLFISFCEHFQGPPPDDEIHA